MVRISPQLEQLQHEPISKQQFAVHIPHAVLQSNLAIDGLMQQEGDRRPSRRVVWLIPMCFFHAFSCLDFTTSAVYNLRRQGANIMREYNDDASYGIRFADPNGRSALRAATPRNPRSYPCPTCKQPNRLTPADNRLGYQCDECADKEEGYGY